MSSASPDIQPASIVIGDLRNLRAFEDDLYDQLGGSLVGKSWWEARPDLSDMLRPRDYNGPIIEVVLLPVPEEPVEVFLAQDAKKLNIKGKATSRPLLNQSVEPDAITTDLIQEERGARPLGYGLFATTKPSGRPQGTLSSILLYVPPTLDAKYERGRNPYGILRFCTEPVITVTPKRSDEDQSATKDPFKRDIKHPRRRMGGVSI